MLPSADAAMVAFAEVTSFVRYYARAAATAGTAVAPSAPPSDDALPKLFAQLRAGNDPDASLLAASGADLAAWDTRWKAYVAGRPHESLSALFGLGGDHSDAAKLRDLRDRSRLAELLLAREHAPEAVLELDRIELAGAPVAAEAWERAMGDPGVRWLRARALEAAGRQKEGEPLVEDPKQVLSSYGPWWATRGRWARMRGDDGAAAASFIEAVSADPLLPEAACETLAPPTTGTAATATPAVPCACDACCERPCATLQGKPRARPSSGRTRRGRRQSVRKMTSH